MPGERSGGEKHLNAKERALFLRGIDWRNPVDLRDYAYGVLGTVRLSGLQLRNARFDPNWLLLDDARLMVPSSDWSRGYALNDTTAEMLRGLSPFFKGH